MAEARSGLPAGPRTRAGFPVSSSPGCGLMLSMLDATLDPMMEDRDLLHRFRDTRAEEAFAELVQRHRGMVHAACRRMLGLNHAQLDDAVQAVFIILMRKVSAVRDEHILGGWLHTTARGVCGHVLREEKRRHQREA